VPRPPILFDIMGDKRSILFICLGNICRSPIAEAVFLNLIKERGVADSWIVDSAALGPWHIGKSPDPRAMDVLKNKKIPYSHKARQVKADDFNKFDFIMGMDDDNLYDLNQLAPTGSKSKVGLLGEHDPEGERIIEDPYYQKGDHGFYKCFDQCVRSCKAFLDTIK